MQTIWCRDQKKERTSARDLTRDHWKDEANLGEVLVRPKRDGSSPVSVSRDVPITSVLEPVSESILADKLRDPER